MVLASLLTLLLILALIGALLAAAVVGVTVAARTRRAAVLWLLAVITRRQLPLAGELESLGEGLLGSERWRLNAAASRVRAGASLAQALTATPGLVAEDTVILAHIGEQSGRIGETLSAEAARLAHLREAAVAPTTSPSLAMIYLIGVPLVMMTILSGLMIFIIPKYKKILSDFGTPMPWVTEELIASSDVIARFWYLVIASSLILLMIVGIVLVLSRVYAWDFRLPRRIMPGGRGRLTTLALRGLAIAALADRPMTDALDRLANLPRSGADRWWFERVRVRYRGGGNLWQVLAEEHMVSRRDARLLAAAEQASNLPWALNMLADRIDDQRGRRLSAALEIAQPVVVLALGALVLFICLGMFLPLIQLLDQLS